MSPGITPELTDLFVIAVPIALGLGYGLRPQDGLEIAFGALAIMLGFVKLWTDLPDLPDDSVALAALMTGIGILLVRLRRFPTLLAARVAIAAASGVAIGLGALKIQTDFLDPFDILVSDAALVGGAWLLLGAWRARRSGSLPRGIVHPPGEGQPR